MCGRTACTLNKKCLQRATSMYSTKKNNLPQWVDLHKGQSYEPNYNMSPGQLTPVLVMDENVLPHEETEGEHVICPMRWGLIPNWYKGSLEEFSFKTNNSRIEGILEKPTFKGPLSSGRRCVILAEGFFEWKATSSGKRPFFIFFPQENGVSMHERSWGQCEDELWSAECGWKGPRLLTMAGIFDVWKSPEHGNIYSYSVITMPASKSLSVVHTRMPAILDGISQVQQWLDSGSISCDKALSSLAPTENIEMFPVSTDVNNSRNNTISCVLPVKSDKEVSKKQSSKTSLMSWVKIRPRTSVEPPEQKRQKTDE